MKVYVYPMDVHGCGHYRLIWPGRVLAAAGHDVRVVMPGERTGQAGLAGTMDLIQGRMTEVWVPPDADVMVFQRPTDRQVVEALPLIRAKGIAVVVDMDDDLTSIHPANHAYLNHHPRHSKYGHSWHYAEQACRGATLVTTSTPALQAIYAPHGRGMVLHNRVPAAYLDVARIDSPIIAWPGSVHSHPDDLQTVGNALTRLTRAGQRFSIVGPADGVREALHLDSDPPATGPVEIGNWPLALSTIGVGIAPLADSKFNRSKSWLKPVELSACGVPWVASPRVEYRALHEQGCGRLADKPRDWERELVRLAADPVWRAELSAAGRAVAAQMTIEAHAWRWWEAWTEAYRIQRRGAAPLPDDNRPRVMAPPVRKAALQAIGRQARRRY